MLCIIRITITINNYDLKSKILDVFDKAFGMNITVVFYKEEIENK